MTQQRVRLPYEKKLLPPIRTRHPFIYLEHGRLGIKDSALTWFGSDGTTHPVPVALVLSILLGPGVSVTHDAVAICAKANCGISWVGQDSLVFYAVGHSPTADTRNLLRQMDLAANPVTALQVARKMFAKRFPDSDVISMTLHQMMGQEGSRVRDLYGALSSTSGVDWLGRRYEPGNPGVSDLVNRTISTLNAWLYAVVISSVTALGYSPHIGFVHRGSPLPFVYDLADLYKSQVSIPLAFTMVGRGDASDSRKLRAAFLEKLTTLEIVARLPSDISDLLE